MKSGMLEHRYICMSIQGPILVTKELVFWYTKGHCVCIYNHRFN